MIATIAVIAAIVEEKTFSDRSDHSDHIRNHSPAIEATTIAEIEKVPSKRLLSLRSLESGFHMIAAIAEFFPSDRSDHSDHMETRLYCDKSMKRFAAS